jgi:hypothetical protein
VKGENEMNQREEGCATGEAIQMVRVVQIRVHQTGGSWSSLTGYRSGPVPVWAGMKPAQIQNSNLN